MDLWYGDEHDLSLNEELPKLSLTRSLKASMTGYGIILKPVKMKMQM